MGALYFGVGKSMGSLVGGLVIEELGVRNTFRVFGCLALVAASLYFLFSYTWQRRRPGEDVEKDSSTVTDQEGSDGDKTVSRKQSQLGNYWKGTFNLLLYYSFTTKILAVPFKLFIQRRSQRKNRKNHVVPDIIFYEIYFKLHLFVWILELSPGVSLVLHQ